MNKKSQVYSNQYTGGINLLLYTAIKCLPIVKRQAPKFIDGKWVSTTSNVIKNSFDLAEKMIEENNNRLTKPLELANDGKKLDLDYYKFLD